MSRMIIGGDDMEGFGEFLETMMKKGGGNGRGKEKSAPMPMREAVEATLKEIAEGYGKCPFTVGQLVTPKPGMNLRDEGAMHIVLYVDDNPHHHFNIGTGEAGTSSTGYGRFLDIRVLCLAKGGGEIAYVPFWMESWQLQPYDPDRDPNYK